MQRHVLGPVALAAALSLAAAATAAPTRFVALNFTEPANPGLAVTGPLAGYHVTATARVVVPSRWHRLGARAGRLRFSVTQNPACHYNVTYSVRSLLAPGGTAVDVVTAGLPAAGPRYVLDSGERGNAAFRVVRKKAARGHVRLDALWVTVLTKRTDIAPAGQVAWAQIRVTAQSRKGDECHSGTWRQSLGPDIGDSLAVARAKLHFISPKEGST